MSNRMVVPGEGQESRYWRAVGAVEALMDKTKTLGQCLKGGGAVRRLKNAMGCESERRSPAYCGRLRTPVPAARSAKTAVI